MKVGGGAGLLTFDQMRFAMKLKLYWLLYVLLNGVRLVAVLAILERFTGYALDWPNGLKAWPELVLMESLDDAVLFAPYVLVNMEDIEQ